MRVLIKHFTRLFSLNKHLLPSWSFNYQQILFYGYQVFKFLFHTGKHILKVI